MVATGATTYGHSGIISPLFLASSETASPGTHIVAITVLSADVTLSFVQSGHIAEIPFKEGDRASLTLL